MNKPVMAFILVLAAYSAGAAHARSLCEPTSAAGNAAWSRVHVRVDDLKAGRTLLGLDGSRVIVKDTWQPAPGAKRGADVPWQARVDWSSHAQPADNSPSTAVLYFDADDKGVKYPCRVEVRDFTEEYMRRNGNAHPLPRPTPADIRVSMLAKISYDQRARIAGVAEYRLDDRHIALMREKNQCFYYNQTDGFLGAAPVDADTCTASSPGTIEERYVYTDDGKLLRRIDSEKSMPGLDGRPFVVKQARITVYDEAGKPRAEYAEDEKKRHYRRSLAEKDDLTRYHGLKLIASANAIDIAALQAGSPSGFWQFYSLPTSVANLNDGVNDPKYLLASGNKERISAADKAKLWTALNKPDHDLMLDAQGKFLLVPEVSPAMWKTCGNDRSNTREACP